MSYLSLNLQVDSSRRRSLQSTGNLDVDVLPCNLSLGALPSNLSLDTLPGNILPGNFTQDGLPCNLSALSGDLSLAALQDVLPMDGSAIAAVLQNLSLTAMKDFLFEVLDVLGADSIDVSFYADIMKTLIGGDCATMQRTRCRTPHRLAPSFVRFPYA